MCLLSISNRSETIKEMKADISQKIILEAYIILKLSSIILKLSSDASASPVYGGACSSKWQLRVYVVRVLKLPVPLLYCDVLQFCCLFGGFLNKCGVAGMQYNMTRQLSQKKCNSV